MKNLLFVFGILLVFTLNLVSAIGVTPGRTTINFEPGLSREGSFSVINTEHKSMGVVLTVRGDLAEYITLSGGYTKFSSSEESKSFAYSLNLPQKFNIPGKYEAEIVVIEVPEGGEEEGTSVGGTTAAAHQVHVYVPYPEKYVEAEINVVESEGKINFVIPVINRGKLDVVSIKAIVDIYDGTETKIMSLETNTDFLNSLDRRELLAKWTPGVNPGRYRAVVSVRYDDEITSVLKDFNIGELFLEILEIGVKDFRLGEIAKFNALVENKWSSYLRDVYLNLWVYNDEGEVMADFKSPTYDINALAKSEMVAYWDTAGVHTGTYDGKMFLRYGEKSTEKNIQLKISEENIEIAGFTGHVLVKGGGGFSLNNLLLILVIFLVVVNVIWFVVVKRLLKRKNRNG